MWKDNGWLTFGEKGKNGGFTVARIDSASFGQASGDRVWGLGELAIGCGRCGGNGWLKARVLGR